MAFSMTSSSYDQLLNLGLTPSDIEELLSHIQHSLTTAHTHEQAWPLISGYLLAHEFTFDIHLCVFKLLFPNWPQHLESGPAWIPSSSAHTHLAHCMKELDIHDVNAFHHYSVTQYADFWQRQLNHLNIVFKKPPQHICDLSQGLEAPRWLPGAQLNIVDSCFTAPASDTALLYQDSHKQLRSFSYGELRSLSNRIAHSLIAQGYVAGDAIAIAMPMTPYAVAIYLAIIKMGGVVVSIADSFSSEEIATRLHIAKAKALFTQDFSLWGGKKLPLYEKICALPSPMQTIVLASEEQLTLPLKTNDLGFDDFLVDHSEEVSLPRDPMAACNILFSSGTTAQPKAIVWNHTTAIKAASDAYFHQDIHKEDIICWPTNLGWMMGPWLIFAAFINQATIALYTEAPKDRAFGEFIQKTKVTILGVVPTLVATWRQTHCMEKLNWQSIKLFTSTGESSNPCDMFYLMWLANYKPIIEYCGGTEIGGAYLSSTLLQNNYPSLFSTPAMGLDIKIINETGQETNEGEVAIVPPSMGLSTVLLNADHHHVYFANMPILADGTLLRRHGDEIKRLPNGYYLTLGRVDDAMNLGGIKISATEIERALSGIPSILEVAAVAVSAAQNGPDKLVIYAATTSTTLSKSETMQEMQKRINTHLNPLFKIHDLIFTRELPKTASNKILRRVLKKSYSLN